VRLSVFLVVILCKVDASAAPFRLVEIGPVDALLSWAVDINENGVVLGNYAKGTNSYAFLWRDGTLKTIELPGINGLALALNNSEEFVGTFYPPPILLANGAEWRPQALKYSGGTISLLAEGYESGSEGWAINDRGDVVGSLGRPGYINGHQAAVLAPELVLFSSWQGGFTGPPSEYLVGINNSRVIIGNVGQTGYRWTAFSPGSREYLDDAKYVRGINGQGQVVGSGGSKLSSDQPALWNGTNVTWLGAPLSAFGVATDISDSGAIVGRCALGFIAIGARESYAMLWTNRMGIDLETLTELPAGIELRDAAAVNSSGWIAANAVANGTNRAVLLVPTGEGFSLPEIGMVAPNPGLQSTNTVDAELKLGDFASEVRRVEYHLQRRYIQPAIGGGDFYQPARWQSYGAATNTVLSAPFSTRFENLPAGQYAVNAMIETSGRVRAYTVPVFFTVIAPVTLEALRVSLQNDFQYGFNGQAGALYEVQECSDLVNWQTVTNSPRSAGGAFGYAVTNGPQRFFRTRVISRDPEYFGATIPDASPPERIEGLRFTLWSYSNEPVYDMKFNSDTVEITFGEGSGGVLVASYSYRIAEGRGKVSIATAELEICLELEWSIFPAGSPLGALTPNDWRAVELRNGTRREIEGRFFGRGF
jgi:uncharacterized membrane protein